MFGFGKKKITVTAAVDAYIKHTAEVAVGTYDGWVENFIKSAEDWSDVPPDRIADILSKTDSKLIYFSALLALDAVAIENCFDTKTATALYGDLIEGITRCYSKDGDEVIAEIVPVLLGKVADDMKDLTNMPHDSITFGLMECLGLYDLDETKQLFQEPTFVTSVSEPLLMAGVGWWKNLSGKMTVTT